jgi:MFS superfamily sulfate permease-like transporter
MKKYLTHLKSDFPSSIVVFLIALPLCLGIAIASNAPAFSGIIAGIVGGIVVASISKSPLSVSGPAAGLTAIVAAAVLSIGSFQSFLAAVVICGILQLLFGIFKAGDIGSYVPSSVIKGMLTAIGLILIINQFPLLVGYQVINNNGTTPENNIFINLFHSFKNINHTAATIGFICLLLYFFLEKFLQNKNGYSKLIPIPLIIVFVAVLLNGILPNALQGNNLVTIPVANNFNDFIGFFNVPDWNSFLNKEVVLTGVTLAIVASLETLLSIEAIDNIDTKKRRTPANRELKAQGVGNIISGLIGGLPITSVIVRSSANANAGAKSKMSAILHGVLLLLCVAFIPFVLNIIPKAALAAILIFTGYKLAKPAIFKALYRKGFDQFIPFLITIIAILATDLLRGVLIGIVFGIFFIIRNNYLTTVFIVNDRNKYLFRLRKDISFFNKANLKKSLNKIPQGSYVLFDITRADFIDKDIIELIEEFYKNAPQKLIYVDLKYNNLKQHGLNISLIENIGIERIKQGLKPNFELVENN